MAWRVSYSPGHCFYNMYVYSAQIEVTRSCQLCCAHCLRGDSEDRVIRKKYITRFFETVNEIGTLTITGGEPTLVPEIVQFIADEIERLHVSVEQVFIRTNGQDIPLEFALAVTKLQWLSHPQEESFRSIVEVSQDKFHDSLNWSQKERILALGYAYQKDHKFSHRDMLNEGYNFGLSTRNVKPESYLIEDDDRVVEGYVYLNAKGYIISNCDFSYQSQEEPINTVCHVNKLSIAALRRYNKRIERST